MKGDPMARSTIKQKVEVTLVLDEREADWLRGMVQNYLGGGEEDPESYAIRKSIFDALPNPSYTDAFDGDLVPPPPGVF
jgi:hypothetical protein